VVAVACRIRAGSIKDNTTARAFLGHEGLLVRACKRLLRWFAGLIPSLPGMRRMFPRPQSVQRGVRCLHSPRPIMTCCAPGCGPKGRDALVTGPLEDVEEGGIGIGRAEKCIVPSDFADFLRRKREPSLLGNTKDSSMQTTIAQRHTSSLCVLVWEYFFWFIKN
jgi:hypothetical protein